MMFLAVEDAIRVEATSPSVIETVVGGFLLAVAASALTLLGNSIFFRVQSRAKVREELRQFVRDLHQTTVATVVDQVTTAMAAFRLAVYNAPRRDVPRKHRYSGQDLPSYLARSMHGVEATTEFPDRGWVAGSIHRVRTVLSRLRRG